MESYQTEEQQVEAIKGFWKEYGSAIIAGLAIGFAGFIGFNYYQEHQLQTELATADAYIANLESNEKNPDQYNSDGERFITENADSSYASLTALGMAKNVIEHQDWAQAEKYLAIAIAKAPNDGLKAIAVLRLARVQLQQQQFEQALTTLAQPLSASFNAQIEEIKGDAYVLQGKAELARNAYQAAIDAGGLAVSPALQMKIEDLAVAIN